MKHYSKDFKEQALKLSDDIGLNEASKQLGICYGTLSEWRKIRNKRSKTQTEQDRNPLSERELQMQKEIFELKQANEILKDALGFFAKDRKK